MEQAKTFGGIRLLIGAASLVVVIAGIKAGRTILAPFMFAVLASIAGIGPVLWLKRKRVPGPIAAILVTCVLGGTIVWLGTLLVDSISQLVETLPTYQDKFAELLHRASAVLSKYGVPLPEEQSVDTSAAVTMVGNLIGGIFRSFSSAATAAVITVFLLFEAADFQTKIRSALPSAVDVGRLERVTTDVQRYLIVKTLTSAITGLLVGVLCYAMHLDLPGLWGLLAFLLNYIPVVGSIIAAVPAVCLGLLQLGWVSAAVLAVGYAIVNVGVSNFLEPTLMGRQLGLSPLVVFLSLVFWGWVWGPIGMILSVPITMLVKILLENSDDLQWIAVLMEAPRSRVSERLSERLNPEGIPRILPPQPEEDEVREKPKEKSAAASN